MNSDDKKTQDSLLSVFYDLLFEAGDTYSNFYNFVIDIDKELNAKEYQKILLSKKNICCMSNLFLFFKNFKDSFIKNEYSKKHGLKNLVEKLNMIFYMKTMAMHLKVNIDVIDREKYFNYLINDITDNKTFINIINKEPVNDVNNLRSYFITRNESHLSGLFLLAHEQLYNACNIDISGEPLPFLDFNNKKIDSDSLFNSVNEPYHILQLMIKRIGSVNLTESQFYNNLLKFDYNIIENIDFLSLLKQVVQYKENRSLKYLLSFNPEKSILVDLFIYIVKNINDVTDSTIKINLILDYIDIGFCYESLQQKNNKIESIFELICHYEKLYVWDILKSKGADIGKIPYIDNFLEYSLYRFEIMSAMSIFKTIPEYILARNNLVYTFFYNYALTKIEPSLNINEILLLDIFIKDININPFFILDKNGTMLIHNLIKELGDDYLNKLLILFMADRSNSTSFNWQNTNDLVGNNFVHLCLYSIGFIKFSPFLIKYKELMSLFLKPNNQGLRPVDFILATEKDSVIYLLCILDITISPDDKIFSEAANLIEKYSIEFKNYKDVRNNCEVIKKSLDEHYPSSNDYIMYDVYTTENVEKFKIYVDEMLPPESTVKPWVDKLKTISGSKKLMFSTQIKKNLAELRRTFPNFKEFIDHIESYIYLNDMGTGFFWIPASLLVSAPGIGKTFFLHCLSNAVGVSYDMISMESVTAGFVLAGSSQQWAGGQPGLIFQNVFKSEYANHILILDEVDKTTRSNFPVESVLLPLLETHTAQKFKDEFVNMPMDISKMIWVATANRIDQISDPIKSRFQVFNIPSPNFEERMILTQAIYNSLLKANDWGDKFEKELSHDILSALSKDKNSSRDLRKTILDACGRSAKRNDTKLIFEDLNILRTNKETLLWDKKHD